MLEYLRRLGLLDILSVSLIAIATGLGFSVGILATLIPFAYPTALIAIVAVFLASLAAIIQSISANEMAENIEPESSYEEQTVPERWHRELVDRAYNEGYSEGRLRGYEEGLRTHTDSLQKRENRQTQSKVAETPSQTQESEKVESEQPVETTNEEMVQGTEKEKEDDEEDSQTEEENEDEDEKRKQEDVAPEVEERLNELEREIEKE